MAWSSEAAQHDADHGEAEEGGDGPGVALEVSGQAAVSADPGECAFNDPSLGQHDEAMRIASFDDLQAPATGPGDEPSHLRPLIAGIGKDALDERKGSPCSAQQVARPVAILHISRVDGDAQQQAQRVDQDVALAAGNLLARIKALRVERGAPF